MRGNKNKGFTLIELMIVIAIIGTLAGIAVPNFMAYRQKALQIRVILELKMIEKEIFAFEIDRGIFPINLAQIGLDTLRDPWGNPYRYLPVQGTSQGLLRKDRFLVPVNTDFDLYSSGPDGQSMAPFTNALSYDDIVRANNGQFVGPVSRYE